MATRKTTSANRTTLVKGCGTILETNRLKGGYKLVKRKTKLGAKKSTPAKRRGRPARVVVPSMVSTPAKRRGRPARVVVPAMVSTPAKRRGRPARVVVPAVVSVPTKRRGKKRKMRRSSTKA